MPQPTALLRVTASVPVGMEGLTQAGPAPQIYSWSARAQHRRAGLAADQGIMQEANSGHRTTAEKEEHTARG